MTKIIASLALALTIVLCNIQTTASIREMKFPTQNQASLYVIPTNHKQIGDRIFIDENGMQYEVNQNPKIGMIKRVNPPSRFQMERVGASTPTNTSNTIINQNNQVAPGRGVISR